MNRMCIPLSFGLILAILSGCPSPYSGVAPGPVVYVAGHHLDGANVAAYWKDDGIAVTEVDLHTGVNSEATDIYVDADGKVFVSGYYYDGVGGFDVAVYWTDDGTSVTEHILHDASGAQATGLSVGADGTVYVSGQYDDGTNDIAAYWTDDGIGVTETDLHAASASRATGIRVDAGGGVYASGYRSGPIAVYWVDGGTLSETDLYAGHSDANAVAVDGSAVYIAGRYQPASTVLAAYWTGSAWTDLSASAGNAWDVVRYGGQTYTAGNYLSGANQQAAYWTGASETLLNGNLSNTFAFGIYVYDGHVYASGVQNTANSPLDAEAVYWRDGILADLSAGGGSRGNAIFVR